MIFFSIFGQILGGLTSFRISTIFVTFLFNILFRSIFAFKKRPYHSLTQMLSKSYLWACVYTVIRFFEPKKRYTFMFIIQMLFDIVFESGWKKSTYRVLLHFQIAIKCFGKVKTSTAKAFSKRLI